MAEAYGLAEAQFIQWKTATSAANGLTVSAGIVPAGKVWTVLGAYIATSVGETQDFWFSVVDKLGSFVMPVVLPIEFTTAPATYHHFPFVREGMEFKLFQGEQLWALRDAATAGSTITIVARIIESDMPLYEYIEPQLAKRLNQMRSEVVQRVAAAGGAGTGGGGGRPAGFRGGTPRPK